MFPSHDRLIKLQEIPEILEIIIHPKSKIEIHGWRKLKKKGPRKWFPIIKKIGLNEVYQMNNEDWDRVYAYMRKVAGMATNIPSDKYQEEQDGFFFHGELHQYPPRICIYLEKKIDATPHIAYTTKEKTTAAELAALLAQPLLDKFNNLKIKRGTPPNHHALAYFSR